MPSYGRRTGPRSQAPARKRRMRAWRKALAGRPGGGNWSLFRSDQHVGMLGAEPSRMAKRHPSLLEPQGSADDAELLGELVQQPVTEDDLYDAEFRDFCRAQWF